MCGMREFSLDDSERPGMMEYEERVYRMIDSYEGEDGVL
jgi:hypothetical protein